MRRPQRTAARCFVLVMVLAVGALFWASRSPRVPGSAPAPALEDPAAPAEAGSVASWAGELLMVRAERAIVARTASGSERAIYQAPDEATITAVDPIGGGQVAVHVQLADGSLRLDTLTVASGEVTSGSPAAAPALLLAVRPGTTDRVEVRFSNAERDYGSSLELVRRESRVTIFHTTEAISALAWRADGEVLAVGAQASLVLVAISGSDTRTIRLPNPVTSLSWHEGTVDVVTTSGPFELAPGAASAQPLALAGPVGSDLVTIGPEQYAWLAGEGLGKQLVIGPLGGAARATGVQASQLIGVLP